MSVEAVIESRLRAFRESRAAGRLAHAYIVEAPPRLGGLAFVEALRKLLLCSGEHPPCGACKGCRALAAGAHPDAFSIAPESKSRVITVEQVRGLTGRLARTASEGGWKIGVIVDADRMNTSAANALLKTLEEPAGRTLLLLVTGAPQALLSTVRSRCQLVRIAGEGVVTAEACPEDLLEILRETPSGEPSDALFRSARVCALLEAAYEVCEAEVMAHPDENEKKDEREARIKARFVEERSMLLRFLLLWNRDRMACAAGGQPSELVFRDEHDALMRQARTLHVVDAMRLTDAVEEAHRRLSQNLPVEPVIDALFDAEAAVWRKAS